MTFTMLVEVTIYNNHSSAIRWQIPDFLSDQNSIVCIFSSVYLPKFPLEKFDLVNLDQGHGEQHSQ